jgi:GT2 family glycosyltransferase
VHSKKSVSVIIPNYNGKHLLQEYLPYTFAAINNAGVKYEIIIVDDCSTDDSVAFIKDEYPHIKLLVNSQNKGFSYSCNQGIQAAIHELILLLNSDVKLTPDYFEALWPYFLEPDTFGVMGQIKDMNGEGIQDAARMPKFNGFKIKTAWFYYTNNCADRLYTFYLSGANALVDAAKLKAMGGFNELFSPFYGEDFELGIRAWRLNWKCYYEHNAICRHSVSASTKNYKTAQWVKSIYYRNRFFVHALHLNGFRLWLWFLQISFIDLFPKIIAGQWWMWKSYTSFLKSSSSIKLARQNFKQLMQQNNSITSMSNVVDTLTASVADKKLIRVKE